MFVHAPSGAASFAACQRLFRYYPLAVNPQGPASGWQRSIVLRYPMPSLREPRLPEPSRPASGLPEHARSGPSLAEHGNPARARPPGTPEPGFHVLTQDPDERFTLGPWLPGEGECQEIRPGSPVSAGAHQVITEGLPVPRAGALLGWVSGGQVTALLCVFHGQAAASGQPVSLRPASFQPVQPGGLPKARVLARAGSGPACWPPFTLSPLDEVRLWHYVARGDLADVAPDIVRGAAEAFWVPSQNPARASQGHGCAVIGQGLAAGGGWLPAGIYMDHWMLREGVPTPPADHLLTLPGTAALAGRLTPW